LLPLLHTSELTSVTFILYVHLTWRRTMTRCGYRRFAVKEDNQMRPPVTRMKIPHELASHSQIHQIRGDLLRFALPQELAVALPRSWRRCRGSRAPPAGACVGGGGFGGIGSRSRTPGYGSRSRFPGRARRKGTEGGMQPSPIRRERARGHAIPPPNARG